nr:immunoglobulin light chain junction region [Macaca mulatta]MOW40982.1 immunoglobulin light chain junction region [Macaca mulatta]MOW41078.1 immunoglobulin light chain junction region [Macaca mulatta]MOW41169.1 immunoglobulin light chain junction region [Macaca mulatta]MOW41214.1 immunoglobulin light chain junction region [Macaca mulatta]
CMQALEFPVTF